MKRVHLFFFFIFTLPSFVYNVKSVENACDEHALYAFFVLFTLQSSSRLYMIYSNFAKLLVWKFLTILLIIERQNGSYTNSLKKKLPIKIKKYFYE